MFAAPDPPDDCVPLRTCAVTQGAWARGLLGCTGTSPAPGELWWDPSVLGTAGVGGVSSRARQAYGALCLYTQVLKSFGLRSTVSSCMGAPWRGASPSCLSPRARPGMAAAPCSRGHRLGDLSPWGPPGTAAFRGGAGCVPALGGWLSEKEVEVPKDSFIHS